MQIPRGHLTLPFIKLVCVAIEQELFRKAYSTESMAMLGKLNTNIFDKPTCIYAPGGIKAGEKLWFAGPVSLTRTDMSFPLCKLECGCHSAVVFMNGDKVRTLSAECPVPAWLCRSVSDSASATMSLVYEPMAVDVKAQDASMTLHLNAPVLVPRPVAQVTKTELVYHNEVAPNRPKRNLSSFMDMAGIAGLKGREPGPPAKVAKAASKTRANQHLLK